MMTSTVKGRAEISRGNTPMKKEGSKVSMESFLYKTSGTGRVTPLPFQHAPEKGASLLLFRMGEEFFRMSFFHDEAVRHEYGFCGYILSEMHFMGDDDHGDAEGRDGGDGIQNFPYEFGIERRSGFVKEDDIRFRCKSSGDSRAAACRRKVPMDTCGHSLSYGRGRVLPSRFLPLLFVLP